MTRIEWNPTRGQFAGKEFSTNNEGEGLFVETRNHYGFSVGRQQWTGTCQTPTFHTPKQLAQWIRRHYGN